MQKLAENNAQHPPSSVNLPKWARRCCHVWTASFLQGLMSTDIDPTFVKQILHISKRKREANVQHHSEASDLGRSFEVKEMVRFGHLKRLLRHPARFNQVSSNNAVATKGAKIARTNIHAPSQTFGRNCTAIFFLSSTISRSISV